MKIAGFDIGGANTKVAIINFDNGEIENIEIDLSYLPMWSDNDTLQTVLTELIEKRDTRFANASPEDQMNLDFAITVIPEDFPNFSKVNIVTDK